MSNTQAPKSHYVWGVEELANGSQNAPKIEFNAWIIVVPLDPRPFICSGYDEEGLLSLVSRHPRPSSWTPVRYRARYQNLIHSNRDLQAMAKIIPCTPPSDLMGRFRARARVSRKRFQCVIGLAGTDRRTRPSFPEPLAPRPSPWQPKRRARRTPWRAPGPRGWPL